MNNGNMPPGMGGGGKKVRRGERSSGDEETAELWRDTDDPSRLKEAALSHDRVSR